MSLVEIEDFTVAYRLRERSAYALDGVSLAVEAGDRVGIIGESGSGKTTLAMSIARLLPVNATVASGRVRVGGLDVTALTGSALRRFRRDDVGYVFQSPVASLDPTKRIVRQLGYLTEDRSRVDVREALRAVELPDPERVLTSFPHELSGGMAQRVAIAMALIRSPKLLVADEPTASLDAIVRQRILELLFKTRASAETAVLLFTHDLGSVRAFCDRVVVMYGGRVVEDGPAARVFGRPLHPYTRALLRAAPGNEDSDRRLEPIAGNPPVLHDSGGACAFAPRCIHAVPHCTAARPAERIVGRRLVACHEAEAFLEAEIDRVV